jgi:hypothetical protein
MKTTSKVEQIKTSKKESASRKLKMKARGIAAPVIVQHLIDLHRALFAVPKQHEETFQQWNRFRLLVQGYEVLPPSDEEKNALFESLMAKLTPAVQEYVGSFPKAVWLNEYERRDTATRLLSVQSGIQVLREIALRNWMKRQDAHTPAFDRSLFVVIGFSHVRIVEDRISVALDDWIKVFDGVDAARIQRCAACSQIFWASYKNMTYCSENCATALRNRQYRANNKELIEARRAARERSKQHKGK